MQDLKAFAWGKIADLVAIFARGIVLLFLWRWFISDPFGIRPIDLPETLGLSLIMVIFTARYGEPEADQKKYIEEKQNAIFFWIINSLLVVVLGWFFRLFM